MGDENLVQIRTKLLQDTKISIIFVHFQDFGAPAYLNSTITTKEALSMEEEIGYAAGLLLE
ncbi:hypothetical protein MFLO_00745 [Listeria floridensis FSL S10-1187]|uniref:Uncharacterized protein n=1 Tax=Listeria floridensis FSL S10-1187 TaxID=1265817 RepID=A0ABN0RIE5_9LIST|nr:hypothetical protein MFLO_00745 [Listeria floridensis FSL S10-1187]